MIERSPNAVKLPEMGPRKRANYMNDVIHWATFVGAEVSPDARKLLKTDTSAALRVSIVAQDDGHFGDFHHAAFRARWGEARDLSQPEVLSDLIRDAGMDPDETLVAADSAELRERLDVQTKTAIERGVFGVPAMFVGDEMFWGNDRFELVRHYLQQAR